LSSSRRPSRPLNGWCGVGWHRGLSSAASAIERGRLLDGVPLFPVRRDHAGKDVLVIVVSATAIIPRTALLLADLGNEGHPFELLELDRARGARLRAHIVGLEAERAVEDGLERAAADIDGLRVSVRGTCEQHVLPELATLERPIHDSELDVEH